MHSILPFLLLFVFNFAEDYYEVLGVAKDATDRDIKRAYKKLSYKYHPDRVADSEKAEAAKRFEEIANAYEVLSDPQKRRVYDTQGEAAVRQQGGAAQNPLDLLQKMLNPNAQNEEVVNAKAPKQPGPEQEIILPVSLEELYMGTQVDAMVSHRKVCSTCNGEGAGMNGMGICPKCQGQGKLLIKQQTPLGVMQMEQPCPRCQGKGAVQGRPCSHCHGFHTVISEETQVIFVDAGAKDGEKIVFEDMGDAYPDQGTEDGKLVFRIREQPHPRFERKENDLYTHLTITLRDALLGFTSFITHLDGHNVTIDRTGQCTADGYVEKIEGEGMPIKDEMAIGIKGDLYVQFHVSFPPSLTPEQQTLVREKLFADDQVYGAEYGYAQPSVTNGLEDARKEREEKANKTSTSSDSSSSSSAKRSEPSDEL